MVKNEANKTDCVEISKQDIWIMLFSTIRYSMGRTSYMPWFCKDLMTRYSGCLEKFQVEQIGDEIKTELRLAKNVGNCLGSKYDHEIWEETVDLIEKVLLPKYKT